MLLLSAEWHSVGEKWERLLSLTCFPSLSISLILHPLSLGYCSFFGWGSTENTVCNVWIVSSDNVPLCFDWPSLRYDVITQYKWKLDFIFNSDKARVQNRQWWRQKWQAKGDENRIHILPLYSFKWVHQSGTALMLNKITNPLDYNIFLMNQHA